MSIDISVDVSGLERISKTLNFIDIGINGELTMEELLIVAERILELAQQTIAFDTGAARDSLQIIANPSMKSVSIGSDGGIRPDGQRKKYLRYLELGTSRMSARPFLVPALLQALNEFKQRYPGRIKEMSRIII